MIPMEFSELDTRTTTAFCGPLNRTIAAIAAAIMLLRVAPDDLYLQ